MTSIVTTRCIPADAATFVARADVRDDYRVGPAVLVCVDVRGTGSATVRTYAATVLVDGVVVVDAATAFEDMWGEVVAA